MFIFMPRVFVPCLYSLSWIWGGGTESWDSISIVLWQSLWEWGETAWAGATGLSLCSLAFRQTILNSLKGKGFCI